MTDSQPERAARFLALHHGPGILLLCNVWDAASARLVEDAGFPALATTSAGVSWSLGFADGERAPFEEVLEATRRIVRAVRVPVSADIEAGFGETPSDTARSCRAVVEAGAVGVNLEDGTGDPQRLSAIPLHCDKIRAAKEAVAAAGGALVVNARTDVYLKAIGAPETRRDDAVGRCNAYLAAGADGVFVPGVADEEVIAGLVKAIDGPLNILAGPATPPAPRLASLGVARVSLGSGPMRAAMGLLSRIAHDLLDEGTYRLIAPDAITHAEANALFRRDRG